MYYADSPENACFIFGNESDEREDKYLLTGAISCESR